ncbi:MAG: flagellar hook-basal body complex protein [Pseudomonadota bacterium]
MSLFGSLYTSVSGLNAQSQSTAIISNNIANVNTTGFKRSEASFASLVTVESASARYSPGAVKVNRLQQVDEQGQIQQTASSTDVAISGDGFFTVRSEESLDIPGDFKFTRNGQFFENENGILQNSAGMFLYGWEVDPRDADPNASAGVTVFNADLSALVPVDVSLAAGQSRQTTEGTLGLNLDADEVGRNVNYDPLAGEGVVPYPTTDLDFTRTLRVYDSLGAAQDVTFEFIKINGPQAAVVSGVQEAQENEDLTGPPYNIADGSTFDLQVAGNPVETFTVDVATGVNQINDLLEFVNNYAGGGVADAYLNDEGSIVITGTGITAGDDLVLTDGVGTPLASLAIPAGTVTSQGLPTDNTAVVPPFTDTVFPQIQNGPPAAAYNGRGWWQVNVVGPNIAVPLTQGLVNFNADGTLNAQSDLDGNRDIELRNVDWGNGSETQNININIDGFTQFAGLYNVSFASQDGAELGLKTGVEIDREGFVNARFSNGTLSRLYKLPIVTFESATNLQEISTTSYVESAESGEPLVQEAGVSQAGFLESAALEQSNVDLADEFTKLIISQRAYSANTRVINTVDQMTEDLLRLR